jgi:hypothetical protein
MNEMEVFEKINSGVKLDHAKFIIAKQYLLNSSTNTRLLDLQFIITQFLAAS